MKILLTGAQGNFGREFIRQTSAEIIQLNRDDWHELDFKLTQGIDIAIHAASDLHSKASVSPASLMDSNLLSTTKLLEAMKRNHIKRLVFLSSCAVYGEDMRTNEESQCCPVSINGICKLLNEKLIAEFCSAHDIKFEILRIFNSYGGLDNFSVLSRLERALQTGTPFTMNNLGMAQRDFIHVSDVAAIVAILVQMEIPCTYMNIGTGIATKISTLVNLVSARFPKLSVQHAQTKEAEYSRADISRLREFVRMDFVRIEDYVENSFMGRTVQSA